MDYGFKVTTNGRALIAACGTQEAALVLTRVAFGSGLVGKNTNLADIHALVNYIADGRIGKRRHENNRLYLSVQYANADYPEQETFYLSEFMIYARNAKTGEECDLIYATLGDYRQPVPEYSVALAPSTWNFPLVTVVSDEIEISITAPAGLITCDDLGKGGGVASLDMGGRVPETQLPIRHRAIASRIRAPGKPDYGLGGGGEQTAAQAVLEAGAYTGTAQASVTISGTEYDAKNISLDAKNAPSGALIIRKLEE